MDWPLAIVIISVVFAVTVIFTSFIARPKK